MLRLILVDDEQIVLRGIQHVLSKCSHICEIVGTANSGKNGLQMIDQLRPDVVITDVKMPDIDGIELIKRSMQKHPNLYIIILSGYAEFQFARDALRYGAYDYLLKPCKHKYISNLLEKILGEMEKNSKDRQIQKELEKERFENKKEIERRKILDVILGKCTDSDLEMKTNNIRVLVIEHDNKIAGKEKIIRAISETIMKTVHPKCNIQVLDYANQYILIFTGEYDLKDIKLQLYLLKLKTIKMGCFICGGISHAYDEVCGLRDGYQQCSEIIEYLQFNEIKEIREIDEIRKEHNNRKNKADDTIFDEDSIIEMIFWGKKRALERELNNTIYHMNKQNALYSPKTVRTQIKQLMILVEKKLKEKQITLEMVFNRSIESIYEIQKIKSYRQLLNWCKNMLIMICSYIQENKSHLPKSIRKALNYIDNNYNMAISLRQISQLVYLNPWYFSDLFKEKVGIAFSDYLTNVRIYHAKKLLEQTELKNYEIAEKVGFKNTTYFNMLFKKKEGMTPKAFRELT